MALRFALRDFRMRKFAAALTILAIASGVAAYTALRVAGLGVELAARRTVERALAGEVVVYGDGPCDLSELAVERLRGLPGVDRVVPVIVSLGYVDGALVLVVGVESSDLDTVVSSYVSGRGFDAFESEVAVIDVEFSRDRGLKVGDAIFVKVQGGSAAYPLTVVGVGDVTIELYGLAGVTAYVVVPLRDAQRMLGREGYVTMAMLLLDGSLRPSDVEEETREVYPEARVFKREEIMRVVSEVLSMLNALLLAVTSIGLAVAVLGTANTVMSNVREHARDIAVLRALGARALDVAVVFMLEGLMFGFVGGVLGTAAGLFGAKAVAGVFESMGIRNVPLVINAESVLASIAVSMLVSVGASLYPAARASGISPIRVLKNE